MNETARTPALFTPEFIGLCLLVFLIYCNITVFYNLYGFLAGIGIAPEWRGFLIGCSSLSTIALFLVAGPFLTRRNAPRWACLGAFLLLACGLSYGLARGVAAILAVRLVHGAAISLLTASCMTLLVSSIPPERGGQAFSFYSVAILLPYSIVPLVFDLLAPLLPSPAWGYGLMALLLLPATAVIRGIDRRSRGGGPASASAPMGFRDMFANARRPPVALLLTGNAVYLVTFSSLFFMAKSLFQHLGHANVGSFFTIQMCGMIAVRVLANRVFDRIPKARLIRVSFALSAASFGVMAAATSLAMLYLAALVMGLGMGLGSPALYGLMFSVSEPRFKAVNSNLMMVALQIGNFLGPMLGAFSVHQLGFSGFLAVDALVSLLGVLLGFLLVSRRVDPEGRIAAF